MKHAWLWTWGVFYWFQIKLELTRPRGPDTYSVVQYLVQPGLGQQWLFKEEDESPWTCPTPLSKGSKNVSPSFFFWFSHPGQQNLAQRFLVPVAAQACNKLSSNELEPPVLGDVSASCFSAGAGSGIFFSLKHWQNGWSVQIFCVITKILVSVPVMMQKIIFKDV